MVTNRHQMKGILKEQNTRPLDESHIPAPEKAMAPHSSTLAWKIPGTEEASGLPSLGSHRVGHD